MPQSDSHDAAKTPSKENKPPWLLWALGSGAFAATNGVFAKLYATSPLYDNLPLQDTEKLVLTSHSTTADTTHHLSERLFDSSAFAEYVLRAVFFGMNLLSNAIMWILFTRALTAASSTTRVSVLNTSANFLVTAVYGLVIFSESFTWEWVLGAALLVAGCVVIGRREGGEVEKAKGEIGEVAGGEGAIRLSGDDHRSQDPEEESEPANDSLDDSVEATEETRKEREVLGRLD